jgi:ribonucleoside-diphosphate reductase beta chain
MSIFDKRETIKPYEYPNLIQYGKAIQKSYWIVDEYNFTNDIQDFETKCTEYEKGIIERTMLAIAQIEVKVKQFWGDIYKRMPKPEIGIVGSIFSESESRHLMAYSELLTLLRLDEKFEKLNDIKEIKGRINYLSKYLDGTRSKDNKLYTKSLMLFSLFIEHVSLFSQFLIMQSFNKHKNIMSGFSNVVDATMQEENLHGIFGIEIVNIIRNEYPDFFDEELNSIITSACIKAYKAEEEIIDWIMDNQDLPFLKRDEIKEFIKNRFNNSLESCGFNKVFEIDNKLIENTSWIELQLNSSKEDDFFYKRSTEYSKFSKPVIIDELF